MMITGRHIAKAAKCQRAPALAAALLAIVYVIALLVLEGKDRGEDLRRPDIYINPD